MFGNMHDEATTQAARYIEETDRGLLELGRQVHDTAARRKREKQAFLSQNRLKSWGQSFDSIKAPDARNRPSDRQFPVRTRADYEVWHRTEMRTWFDKFTTPTPTQGFDPLADGYCTLALESSGKGRALPSGGNNRRMPTPPWVMEHDQAAAAMAQEQAAKARIMESGPSAHFMDFEGNLASSRVVDDRLKALQSNVTRSPPWKERPPQEAPSYKPPEFLMARDRYLQAGGGLEDYGERRRQTLERKAAMHRGAGLFCT